MAQLLETTCGVCGVAIRDYASNRHPTKSGNYYCSRSCAGKGRAYYVSIALGGETLDQPELFQHGKKNRDARYYRVNVDRFRNKANEYYAINATDVIARRQQKDRTLKQEMVAAYGGACVCCRETTLEFLTIDHLNGNGHEHRKRVGKGRKIYADLKALGFPTDEYQLLCFNCNIALGFYGYCPHRPEEKRKVNHAPRKPGRPRTVA